MAHMLVKRKRQILFQNVSDLSPTSFQETHRVLFQVAKQHFILCTLCVFQYSKLAMKCKNQRHMKYEYYSVITPPKDWNYTLYFIDVAKLSSISNISLSTFESNFLANQQSKEVSFL